MGSGHPSVFLIMGAAGLMITATVAAFKLYNPTDEEREEELKNEPNETHPTNSRDEMEMRLKELKQNLEETEMKRKQERAGRVAAEKKLKDVLEEYARLSHRPLSSDTAVEEKRSHTDEQSTQHSHALEGSMFIHPIGKVYSSFLQCLGTPRQGSLAPSTRARIVFDKSISPETLQDLEEFSHLWVSFVFHLNTNAGKVIRSSIEGRSYTFPAKIAPPYLKRRVGLFATRTPHRPNPIGITLAKIEKVIPSRRTVELSGVDLVNETPVIDIKPYVPAYDTVTDARTPEWIKQSAPRRREVRVSEQAQKQFEDFSDEQWIHYSSTDEMRQALTEVLSVDVRSQNQTTRACKELSRLPFDKIVARFTTSSDDSSVSLECIEKET